jgi:hypothetical protein
MRRARPAAPEASSAIPADRTRTTAIKVALNKAEDLVSDALEACAAVDFIAFQFDGSGDPQARAHYLACLLALSERGSVHAGIARDEIRSALLMLEGSGSRLL